MKRRSICVVTGTRAEYGLLYWLIKEIQEDPELELQLLATGAHLSPEFGLTYKSIEGDGFLISEKVEMLLSSDSPVGIAKSMGLAMIGSADALQRLKPDLVVLLGDRYEILAVAQAALAARIPIAHLCGGETTEGAIDEAIRHSLTKMAHLHFVSAEPYRRRVIQLGEAPERVFNYGDTGIDNIRRMQLLSRTELEQALRFDLSGPYLLVTYHPVTLQERDPAEAMESLLQALERFPELKVVLTKPNADAGGRAIAELAERYAERRPERVLLSTSLGQLRYLSAMKHCSAVVGNSSSGIVEAPALGKPTVNLGERQSGRLKAASVIDCREESSEIAAALEKALSPRFQQECAGVESLYGGGAASSQIKECLKRVELSGLLVKRFHDLEFLCAAG